MGISYEQDIIAWAKVNSVSWKVGWQCCWRICSSGSFNPSDAVQVGRSRFAAKETGLEFDVFPEDCIWTPEQILDQAFLPE